MSQLPEPRGLVVLFANGSWKYYPEADQADVLDEEEGIVVLRDVEGGELDEWYHFTALAAESIDFFAPVPEEHFGVP